MLAVADEYFRALGFVPPVLRGNGRALLESGVARAQNAAFYTGADIVEQAAPLANGIALNHPFIDGNKRAAFAACVVFLYRNGRPLPGDAHTPLAQQMIAQHELTDRSKADEVLANWLREHLPHG